MAESPEAVLTAIARRQYDVGLLAEVDEFAGPEPQHDRTIVALRSRS